MLEEVEPAREAGHAGTLDGVVGGGRDDSRRARPQTHAALGAGLLRRLQPEAAVAERLRRLLVGRSRDAFLDIALEEAELLGLEADPVEAAQVGAVWLALVDVADVLGEEAQVGVVPDRGAVVGIEGADGDMEAIERGGHRPCCSAELVATRDRSVAAVVCPLPGRKRGEEVVGRRVDGGVALGDRAIGTEAFGQHADCAGALGPVRVRHRADRRAA